MRIFKTTELVMMNDNKLYLRVVQDGVVRWFARNSPMETVFAGLPRDKWLHRDMETLLETEYQKEQNG